MKKIFWIVAVALATLSLSSCDLEKLPYTAIEEDGAFISVDDLTNYRQSIYSPMKSLTVGARRYYEDIRGDMFHALADFGNFVGLYYAWIMDTNDSDAEAVWFGDYSVIANLNYAINKFPIFLEENAKDLKEEEIALVNTYIAEAKMTRAYVYLDLVTKFCEAYDPATAKDKMGVMLIDTYAPTSDNTKYVGRSSLEDTYQFIVKDLEDAAEGITTAGAPNSVYYTADAVKALRARVALYMKDWTTASNLSHELISSNTYPLAKDNDYKNMWINDSSTENIMLVTMSLQDTGSDGGSYFIYDNDARDGSTPDPQYMPTQNLLDLYVNSDVRKEAFFQTHTVEAGVFGTDDLTLLYKFQGNPALRTGSALNYINMGKPFRISEQYLIAAEADAELGGDRVAMGASALNTLRAARIAKYSNEDYSTVEKLRGAVREERNRELVGEGFRMHDLKRWEMNVVRGASQSPSLTKPGADYGELEKPYNHSRALWPIPKTEIDANPQIKNQQNPGY